MKQPNKANVSKIEAGAFSETVEALEANAKAFQGELPEFLSPEGMRARGLLTDKNEATELGEIYLALENRGMMRAGQPTKKALALSMPMDEILPVNKFFEGQGGLDMDDPEVAEKYELYKLRVESEIDKADDEGFTAANVWKGVEAIGDVAGKAIGNLSTIYEAPDRVTPEQRQAAAGALVEGATEMPISFLRAVEGYGRKQIINPIREFLGTPESEIKQDELDFQFAKATQDAYFNKTSIADLVDAAANTTAAAEIYQEAQRQDPEKFASDQAGGQFIGSSATDPLNLLIGPATKVFSSIVTAGKTFRTAKTLATATNAEGTISRLAPAIEAAGAKAATLNDEIIATQKAVSDAVTVGNTERASALTATLAEQTADLSRTNTQLGLMREGLEVNKGQLQTALTKIDDINAPSMLAGKAASVSANTLAATAEGLGKAVVGINKGVSFLEKWIGGTPTQLILGAADIASGGKAYMAYKGGTLALRAADPVLKKMAKFSRVLGDEFLEASGSSPFWQRVAANKNAGKMTEAVAGVMDFTTPLRAGVAFFPKAIAKAAPPMALYEAINSNGLDGEGMARAGAGAIVFGPFARLVGTKNSWDQMQTGDFFNFRDKMRKSGPESFSAFEAIPDKQVKRFVSSFDAAFPGKIQNYKFTDSGPSFFDQDSRSATINVNDKAGLVKAVAAHELTHSVTFDHQSEAAFQAMTMNIVKDGAGNIHPEFKAWGDEYNRRIVAEGRPPLAEGDLAYEYFTEIAANTLFEDVASGRVAGRLRKSPIRKRIESIVTETLAATPIVKNIHFQLGGATDNTGRMIQGTGLLADGIRNLPEVKAMIRKVMDEGAGRKKPKQVDQTGPAPQAAPKATQANEIISRLRSEDVAAGGSLATDIMPIKGREAGSIPSEYFTAMEREGVINKGTATMAQTINQNIADPVAFLLSYNPVALGRSKQFQGRTVNNVKPIGWTTLGKDKKLYLAAMDLTQLNLNISKVLGSHKAQKLKMTRASILDDVTEVAKLHAKDQKSDAYFLQKYGKDAKEAKNLVNAAQGYMTKGQSAFNPLLEELGMSPKPLGDGIYRTFIFDGIETATQLTSTTVAPFGLNSYLGIKQNLMPQAPRVDVNGNPVKTPVFTPKTGEAAPRKYNIDPGSITNLLGASVSTNAQGKNQ